MLIPVPLLNTDQIMLMALRRLLALFASDVVKVIDAEAKANFRFAGAGLFYFCLPFPKANLQNRAGNACALYFSDIKLL